MTNLNNHAKFHSNIFTHCKDTTVLKNVLKFKSQQRLSVQQKVSQQCRDLIDKAEWPPNSPDLNPLDFCVWGIMLERYERYSPRPRNISELKTALQVIWDSLPLEVIKKAVLSFRKRLQACIESGGGHLEYLLS